jgi:hypothetical protein
MKDSAVPLELRRNLGPRRHHHALLHGLTRALARQPESVTKPMPGPANRLLPCVPPARAGQVRGNKRAVTRPHAAAPRPAPASRRRRHAQPGPGAPLLQPTSLRCRRVRLRQARFRHPRRLHPREGHGAAVPGQHSSQLHALVDVENPEAPTRRPRRYNLAAAIRTLKRRSESLTFYTSRTHGSSG